MTKTKSLIRYILAVVPVIAPAVLLSGCSKDEPRRAEGIQVPSGPRDDVTGSGNDNPSENGGEETETPETNGEDEVLRIVGDWEDAAGKISFHFEQDGSFEARVTRAMGFDVEGSGSIDGTFTYDDFKQWVWLSVNSDSGVYVVEYRCVIDGDKMSLFPMQGTGYTLWRK